MQASRPSLQFVTPRKEAALFTLSRGYMKHFLANTDSEDLHHAVVLMIQYTGNMWLRLLSNTHLTFKEQLTRYMMQAKALQARLRTLNKTYCFAQEMMRAVQVASVQVVVLYGSKL